jgi:predicted CopG family antitoxin
MKDNKHIQSFNEHQENLTDVSDSDFLLKTIADRIRNNVDIIEYADGRESELNIEDCISIIKDDLSRYSISKK